MAGKKSLLDKIIVIVGPTSSGKSELAVSLARRFNGEIVSCDSRQIYEGMDLGTGKVPGVWCASLPRGRERDWHFVYKNVIHHLIDFISPKKQYSVALFQKQAQKIISDIIARGKLPILCGGTGHWIDVVVYNQQIPNVKPNLSLRQRLEKKTAAQLYRQLCKLDAIRARTIDSHNKRRLVRALEIIITTGKPVPLSAMRSEYEVLWIGIKTSQVNLYKKIDLRLKQRLKAGMIQEVQNLHDFDLTWKRLRNLGHLVPPPLARGGLKMGRKNNKKTNGLSWKKLESFGLEYKYVSLFLQKKLSYDEMFTQLSFAIKHYAKRQITWWRRNQEILWIQNFKDIDKTVAKFLK